MNNSLLRYIDPTGHRSCDDSNADGSCNILGDPEPHATPDITSYPFSLIPQLIYKISPACVFLMVLSIHMITGVSGIMRIAAVIIVALRGTTLAVYDNITTDKSTRVRVSLK